MDQRTKFFVFAVLALFSALALQAQTSRQIPFKGLASTLPGCSPAPCTAPVSVDVQLWDDPVSTLPVNLILTEAHRGVSAGSTVVDDAGNLIFLLGSQTTGGLGPDKFPSGSSRFLDVVDPATGASVLTGAPERIPLNAVAFALNPGPPGPKGDKGDTGAQGPAGVVQSVSAGGDASISVGGLLATPTVSVAANGIGNTHVGNGALSPAKITGTAATLGSNNFIGNQNVSGGAVTVSNSSGVALEGIGSMVGVRGSAGANGFAIVGSAPANGTAGQFNGSVNVTANLTAASFSGPITTTTLNCTGCVGDTQFKPNYAGSAAKGGPATSALTATNALALGGVAPSGYAPASGSLSYVAKAGDIIFGALGVGGNLSTGNDLFVGNVTNYAFPGSRSIYFQNTGGDAQNSFRINAGAAAGGSDNLFLVGLSGPGSLRGTGIKFLTAPPQGGQVERMSIDPNGNVSISGTLSAGTLLGAGLSGMQEFTNTTNLSSATYTWTAPPGVTHVMVEMWGGGQGGGCLNCGGGTGATYSRGVVTVTPGASYSIAVGGGGAGSSVDFGAVGNASSMSLGSVRLIFAGGGSSNNLFSCPAANTDPNAAISRCGHGYPDYSPAGKAAFGANFCPGPLEDLTGRGGGLNGAGNPGYVLLTW